MSALAPTTEAGASNAATGNSGEKSSFDGGVAASIGSIGLHVLSPQDSPQVHEARVSGTQWCAPSSSR
jgi:hypothetical protein